MKIRGYIRECPDGDAEDILYIEGVEEPLAEYFLNNISGKRVTVNYIISKTKKTKDKAMIEFQEELEGIAECDYGHAYSEYTGYLWTDEDVMIGGHDLLNELRSHIGKYINLDIKIHTKED